MPIFMDRHELPYDITPEKLSELHQQDLHIEHKHNCKGFTYWLDLEQKYAFCLIQAPNKDAVYNLHKESHGDLPTTIIEVEPSIVESFLGRISDPEHAETDDFQGINDPAQRILMMATTNHLSEPSSFRKDSFFTSKFKTLLNTIVEQHEGRVTSRNSSEILMSFRSISGAVKTAEHISKAFKSKNSKTIRVGLISGFPVTPNTDTFFEEALTKLTRFCILIEAPLILCSELKVKHQQEEGGLGLPFNNAYIVTPDDERFINDVFKFIEVQWSDPKLNLDYFSSAIGRSKSQLYRKLMRISKQSPNNFIRNYRLTKALERLKSQQGNISEIAFETGFNSVGYFTKIFKKAFGVVPSEYIKTLKSA